MLKKLQRKCISVILAAMMLPLCPVARADELLVNESFDGQCTNRAPENMNISAQNVFVAEYKPGNKGLLVYADAGTSRIKFPVAASGELVISFDIMSLGKAPAGALSIFGADGAEQKIVKFTDNADVTLGDGFKIGSCGSSSMTNYAIAYNAKDKMCNVYVNGKLYADNYTIKKATVTSVNEVRFSFASPEGDRAVILDNINIHTGSAPQKSYPTEKYSDETDEVPNIETGKRIGNAVQVNMDFENGIASWAQLYENGNKCEIITEEDGNKAYLFEKTTGDGGHINAGPASISNSDVLVWSFRLKVLDANSFMVLQQKDTAEKFERCGEMNDAQWCFPGGFKKQLKLDRWYNLAFIQDYAARTTKYYFDGEQVSEYPMTADFAVDGADPGMLRFFVTIYTQLSDKPRPTFADSCKFLLDDVRIYEGEELLDDLGDIKRTIDVNTKKTVYSSDEGMRKLLSGFSAIHARSGIVFKDDEKKLLENRPFEKDGVFYLPVDEVCEKLGVSGISPANTTDKDGVAYLPAAQLISAMGKKAVGVNAATNSGLYVIEGGYSFKLPDNENDLQRLNDFMFYLRPLEAEITSAYDSSPNKGQHPRLLANKADFDRIRSECETDARKQKYKAAIIADAEMIMGLDNVPYTVMETGSILNTVCRPIGQRMYSLAMAYQLTGDKKYAERAFREIEETKKYDWAVNNDHLIPPELGSNVALAYDWMYDAWTDEQKQFIEELLYDKVLYMAHLGYMTTSSQMSNGAIAGNNHNIVVNGGIAATALTLFDVYPAEVSYTLRNAIRCTDIMMWHFAPHGAWYEGPHYWEYTLQYTSKMLASLDSVLGTDFGLDCCEGLSETSEFALNTQTDVGLYNYADGLLASNYVPELFWLSDKYKNADVTKILLNNVSSAFNNAEDNVLALLWYDTSIKEGDVHMPVDKYYDDQSIIVMRNTWDTREPTFVGIHAGKTNVDHAQLDGGSFIFEDQGIRWAKELGMGNYALPGYWESAPGGKRWLYFRSRAESHNTVIINPTEKEDHKVDSYAEMKLVENKERGNIVTVDMSEVFADNAYKATRGFFFADNRRSLVIRDQITLKGESDVYWILMTDAEAYETSDGHVALTKNGRKLRLDYIAENATAEFTCAKAAPLPTSPQVTQPEETDNRIMIKLHGSGDITMTVKLSPDSNPGSDVADYNTDISEWHVPDGALPTAPTIDAVNIGDEHYELGGKNSITYNYPEGTLSEVPQVTAESDVYDVSIKQAATLDDYTEITVTDRNDASNTSVYCVYFVKMPTPHQFAGKTSLPVYAYTASDEQVGNEAKHMFDNDINTRYSVEGAGNQTVLDLKYVQQVDEIAVAWYLGDTGRQYYFTVSVSEDGVNYTQVFDGMSSGQTNDFEHFEIGKTARYIKLGLNGNNTGSGENWNGICEFVAVRNN